LKEIDLKSPFGAVIILYVLCFTSGLALAQKGTMAPRADYHDPTIYQSDIAEVYVSMIGARPLNAVIEELQPNYVLTADQAYQKAVPDTLNSSESALSSVKAALQVGLMFGLSNASNSSGAGTSGPPSPLSILTNFPTGTLSVDPVSAYQAGASLFEQVKLLNHSLRDIPHFKGYTPYIVTLQISLIPHKREAPFDAYANIGFFTDTNIPPTPPGKDSQTIPLIYPLLTTDALEAANDQQNLNQLRQLTTSITAAIHSVGIQAGLDQLNQNLNTVNGLNLNSLLTVGKLNQNCMVVRIGARNQPGSKDRFSLVPETHNVSLLVLARTNANELEMTSRTIFRDVLDGTVPKDMTHKKRNDLFIDDVMGSYLLHKSDVDKFEKALVARPNERVDRQFYPYLWKLINDVYDTNSSNSVTFTNFQHDFEKFFSNPKFKRFFDGKTTTSMREYKRFYDNLFDIVWLDSLWVDVARSGSAEQYANDLIPLPRWTPHLPIEDQTVIYKDDGQSTTFTIVNDAGSVPAYKISAKLRLKKVKSNDRDTVLYSRQVTATGDGTALNIQFQPLSEIQLPDSGDKTTNHWRPQQLKLIYGLENEDDFITNKYTHFAILNSSQNTQKGDQQSLPWKIDRTYGSLIAGAASNVFIIVLATNSSPDITNKWFLDVASPIVITNSSPTNGALGQRTNGLYLLQVQTNDSYEVTFTFGPLLAGQTVDFNLLNEKHTVLTNMNHQVVYPSQASPQGANASKPIPP
jgi:hypothetical protein